MALGLCGDRGARWRTPSATLFERCCEWIGWRTVIVVLRIFERDGRNRVHLGPEQTEEVNLLLALSLHLPPKAKPAVESAIGLSEERLLIKRYLRWACRSRTCSPARGTRARVRSLPNAHHERHPIRQREAPPGRTEPPSLPVLPAVPSTMVPPGWIRPGERVFVRLASARCEAIEPSHERAHVTARLVHSSSEGRDLTRLLGPLYQPEGGTVFDTASRVHELGLAKDLGPGCVRQALDADLRARERRSEGEGAVGSC